MSTKRATKIEAIGESKRSRYLIGSSDEMLPVPEISEQIAQPSPQGKVPSRSRYPEPEGGNLAIAPLTEFLGETLTSDNPAWKDDSLPRMRMLQKKLIACALMLPEDERGECLGAISVVEGDVRLRLRWQQMRMTEEEMAANPETVRVR